MKESHQSSATTKLTYFAVSKDEWNAKEDTSKSLKNVFVRTAVCPQADLGDIAQGQGLGWGQEISGLYLLREEWIELQYISCIHLYNLVG